MNTTSIRIPTEAAHRLKMLALPGQSMAGVLAEILPEALDRAEAGRKAMGRAATARPVRDLPNGYYRAEGLSPEWPTFWQVLTYIPSDGGAPYASAWGLSLWGRDGSTPTWAYRTFGSRLAKLFARYPDALWFPDHDRVPEMSVAR